MMSPFWKLFLFGSLKKYRPIQAEYVARFMVKVAHEDQYQESKYMILI